MIRYPEATPTAGRDSVTVLTTKGPLATKVIERRPTPQHAAEGEWIATQYGNAKSFSISERYVADIHELANELTILEYNPRAFIVRGAPVDGIDRDHAYRRLHPRTNKNGILEPASLRPAARHWVPLDIDSIECPNRLDPIANPELAVDYVVGHLPVHFHSVTCYWQFTASQQIKPGLRIRLFFWSDVPLADWQLRQWLADYPVDQAIFAPAQPIYVARPVFIQARDPVPLRSGVQRGERDAITPPIITKSSGTKIRPAKHDDSLRLRGGYEAYRRAIGDHEGGNGFFGPIKSAVASYIAQHGGSVDTTWVRADLEDAIRNAPRDVKNHPDRYIEVRIRDLDMLIRRIIEMHRANNGVSSSYDECEPTYPAPLGSVGAARSRLLDLAGLHVSAVLEYRAAKAAFESLAVESSQPRTFTA